jgi:hypothetical protein
MKVAGLPKQTAIGGKPVRLAMNGSNYDGIVMLPSGRDVTVFT